MKRAVIVHCWSGYPEYCWYPYAKRELERRGFEVSVPAMPDTDEPNLAKWLPKLQEVVGRPDEETYLIGHSSGCITILRYLESLSDGERVGGVVLVAGFLDNLGFEELNSFFEKPLDITRVKAHSKKIVAIMSDNDPYVPLDRADVLRQNLGAEIITKHNMKHFSGAADGEEACVELPDVVETVLKMNHATG